MFFSVLTELIIGYMLPGKPVAMMMYVHFNLKICIKLTLSIGSRYVTMFIAKNFHLSLFSAKTWGYLTMAQAMVFVSDLKLGHYMKIPPKLMFSCQVLH